MKRFTAIISALAISAAFFTGCSKNGASKSSKEIFESYSGFFEASLGSGSEVTAKDECTTENGGKKVNYYSYDITYTTKNGEKRTSDIYFCDFTERDKKYYKTAEDYVAENVLSFCHNEMSYIARSEFCEKIASKYFDADLSDLSSSSIDGSGYRLNIGMVNPVCGAAPDSKEYSRYREIVKERLSTDKGYKLSEADMKSVACDKEFFFQFAVYLDENADASEYKEKTNAMIEDYRSLCGSPQNFSFLIRQVTPEKPNGIIVERRVFFMGEEVAEDKAADFKMSQSIFDAAFK